MIAVSGAAKPADEEEPRAQATPFKSWPIRSARVTSRGPSISGSTRWMKRIVRGNPA